MYVCMCVHGLCLGLGPPSPKHECTVGQAAVGVEPPGLEPSAHMGTCGHILEIHEESARLG